MTMMGLQERTRTGRGGRARPADRPPPESELIGRRLRAILDDRALSLAWLSGRSNVSPSALSLLTRGLIQYPRVSTLRKISDALGIAPGELTGQPDWGSGERAFEGVVVVPVVRLPVRKGSTTQHERGESVTVPASLLEGRERLLAAVIDGAGMSPHVLIGDRVVFDPDAPVEHGTLVLLHRPGLTLAAWHVEEGGERGYRLADGSWLEPDRLEPQGPILYIMRTPPRYRAPKP
jgi:DNA-binding Xre family transcriptional regulator